MEWNLKYFRNNRNGIEMLTIEMVGGEEHCFESPNTKDIKQLVEFFLNELKNKSKYLLALQDYFSNEGNCQMFDPHFD